MYSNCTTKKTWTCFNVNPVDCFKQKISLKTLLKLAFQSEKNSRLCKKTNVCYKKTQVM